MFEIGDVVKFKEKGGTLNFGSSWLILDFPFGGIEIRNISKKNNMTLLVFEDQLVLDKIYYRKLKIEKICNR